MPVYEFRCRTCEAEFEALRPISRVSEAAPCPDGHTDTVRLLSLVAPPSGTSPGTEPALPATGGCCAGGACACSAN